jgi:hypothetical protein
MLAFLLLAFAAGHDPVVVTPPRLVEEWEPFSLRYLCEHSVFLGKVTILKVLGSAEDEYFSTVELQVDETWLGELPSKVVLARYWSHFYGTGYTYTPKVGESCILAISWDEEFSSGQFEALRYRRVEFAEEYHQAVADWRKLDILEGEARRLAEFAWLVEMLKSEALREEATLELLPGEPISIHGLWDRTRYRDLLSTISEEVWAEVEPTLSAEGSHVGGECWHLWYLSQPASALAWLRKQAAQGELGFIPGKHRIFSPAGGFWSEVCDALPKDEADRLGHAVFELGSAISPRDRSPADPETVQVALTELQRVVSELKIPEPSVQPEPPGGSPRSAFNEPKFIRGGDGRTSVSLMSACRTSGFFGFVTVLDKRTDTARFNAKLTLQVEETLIGDARGEQILAQLVDRLPEGLRPSIEIGDRCLVSIEWNDKENYFEWAMPFLPLEQEETYRVAAKAWIALPAEDDPNRLQAELSWLTRFLRDPRVYIDVLPELLREVYLLEHPEKGQGKYRPYLARIPPEAFQRMGEHLSPADGFWAGLAWKVWLYRDGPAAHAWLQQQVKRVEEGWQRHPSAIGGSPARKFWREVAKLFPDSVRWHLGQAANELEYALDPRDGQLPDPDEIWKCLAELQQLVDALTPPAGFSAQPPPLGGEAEGKQGQGKHER